jgi:hypothetical protein
MIGIQNRENLVSFVKELLSNNPDNDSILLAIRMAERAKMSIKELIAVFRDIEFLPFYCQDDELCLDFKSDGAIKCYFIYSYNHVLPVNATLTVFKNMIIAREKKEQNG